MAKQGQGQVINIQAHFPVFIFSPFYYIIISLSFQVLVCAPSNVAVDQLAEKISATGLKVNISLRRLRILGCCYTSSHIFVIFNILSAC